jgi:predicted amidohydrolase YtcJ
MNSVRFLLKVMLGLAIGLGSGCKNKHAQVLLVNGVVHTMDEKGSISQAIAISEGKIVAVGTTDALRFSYHADTIMDLMGAHVFPGLIDAHCHFHGYAMNLSRAHLTGTTSWQEVVDLVTELAPDIRREWIQGWGWDHTQWDKQQFPDNKLLNERFPDRPVFLKRVDGHAAIANAYALRLAGINGRTKVSGGKIVQKNGQVSGLLLDNAMDLVEEVIPEPTDVEIAQSLIEAERNLLAVGLTTVDDAGLDLHTIRLMDSLQRIGRLRIRVYAMANPTAENFAYFESNGPYFTGKMHVCAFKVYADGALGSRGACLLQPFKDDPGNHGHLLHSPEKLRETASKIKKLGFQMATHCIGDSANRLLLRIYGEMLGGRNDERWRIEHCQVVDTNDFRWFREFSVWPSVQPIHAISDRSWAEDRIGKERMKGAYAYKTLYLQNHKVCLGSDFPVEDINPLLGYHAAVARVDLEGNPYGGFHKEEALGRDTALRAMTIWAAEANREEAFKGSIEVGKFADLVIFESDLATLAENQLPYARVCYTIIDGKIVFPGVD